MSKTSRLRFFRKLHVFVKRNALALLIAFSTVLTLGVIALSAYYSFKTAESQPMDSGSEQIVTPTGSTDSVVFVEPLDEYSICKEYAADHLVQDKTTGIWQTHQAIDFSCKDESTAKAVYSGTVESVVNSMMDGTVVTLKINDKLKVVYKCLKESLVDAGDKVQAGAAIGKVGTNVTEKAEGVHLHLEVWQNDKLCDPNDYFAFGDK